MFLNEKEPTLVESSYEEEEEEEEEEYEYEDEDDEVDNYHPLNSDQIEN